MQILKYNFQQHGDERGNLVAIEESEIPFQVKRVYYMFDTRRDVRRGFQAHRSLKQLLICIHGSCKIHLDDGISQEEIVLDVPYEGIYLDNVIWREMYDFSEDAVLMVLASEPYDERDYIRNYADFLTYIKER